MTGEGQVNIGAKLLDFIQREAIEGFDTFRFAF